MQPILYNSIVVYLKQHKILKFPCVLYAHSQNICRLASCWGGARACSASREDLLIIIIHAFIKRRNPTCRSKALNNDVAEVKCKAN